MYPIASYETYKDGQIIFEEGSHGDWLYVIDSGAVELSKKVKGIDVVIQILHPDDVFGELAFIARIPRTAAARAVGETTVGIIDRAFLDNEYNKLSQYFQIIIKSLAMRLKRTTDTLTSITIDKRGS